MSIPYSDVVDGSTIYLHSSSSVLLWNQDDAYSIWAQARQRSCSKDKVFASFSTLQNVELLSFVEYQNACKLPTLGASTKEHGFC